MKNGVIEKLNAHISGGLHSEADVVYVMVEIRKLLEHLRIKGRDYSVLAFYCDWVLHTSLDRYAGSDCIKKNRK